MHHNANKAMSKISEIADRYYSTNDEGERKYWLNLLQDTLDKYETALIGAEPLFAFDRARFQRAMELCALLQIETAILNSETMIDM